MPEVIINGPEGRLEGRYSQGVGANAPIALFLHPHPQHGGTMNNRVVYTLYQAFTKRGFSCLRFNFRGVGRSQGRFAKGEGELSDAASALDWLQSFNENARECWIAGFSFGAWIGMQLLMRRPEITGFISVAPPANQYDFSFLAPCPASGLMIHGGDDDIVPSESVGKLAQKINAQKTVTVEQQIIDDANHFFGSHLDDVERLAGAYVDAHSNAVTPVAQD
ncbi:MAG: alpha/beta hydrolase [Alphaproteobacteria bacterium]|nr:alpha/beta hydrolase [Alphaproteobacteria bacterium]